MARRRSAWRHPQRTAERAETRRVQDRAGSGAGFHSALHQGGRDPACCTTTVTPVGLLRKQKLVGRPGLALWPARPTPLSACAGSGFRERIWAAISASEKGKYALRSRTRV